MEKKVLAIDFGASSGRAMIGTFDGSKIHMKEIHRFSNDPVIVNGTMYWDVLRLFHEIKQSLLKAKKEGEIDSLSVDTWGVDFGLLDRDGKLLENPVHYRDSRTVGMLQKSASLIDPDTFYRITGNQFMEINTAFQLLSLRENRPHMLAQADGMLMMPDLFHYFLCGKKVAEQSIASTTQLYDASAKTWSDSVLDALGIPKEILPPIVPSGTIVGTILPQIQEELGVSPIQIIASCGHDTQCAQAAVPTKEDDFVFLSCGTWSLLGTECDHPIIDERSRICNLTNEAGYGQKNSFLKNIIGLWLVQESRRQWEREGIHYSFGQLEQMAQEARPFSCFIDPDDPVFSPAGNIPERIRTYCRESGQYVPQTPGEIIRCINESLALKYGGAIEELKQCTGKHYRTLYMVGGGIQSRILCQMTANACGIAVSAGPVEATVLGNIAIQLMAAGAIGDLRQAREVIRNSQEIVYYEPKESERWREASLKYWNMFGEKSQNG